MFGTDYPTPDGTNVRDYIDVRDLADAHLEALEATAPADLRTDDPAAPGDASRGRFLALNLGSATGFSVREVIAAAERGRRPGDPGRDRVRAGQAIRRSWWPPPGSRARCSAGRRDASSLDEMIGSAWAWRQRHPTGYPADGADDGRTQVRARSAP